MGRCDSEVASPEEFMEGVLVGGIREVLGEKFAMKDATYFQELGILKAWANQLCPLLLKTGLPYLARRAGLRRVNNSDIERVGEIMLNSHALDCLRQTDCDHMDEFRAIIAEKFPGLSDKSGLNS